ncbi:FAD-dependent oxidoreductase [Chloroflexota bacterium]
MGEESIGSPRSIIVIGGGISGITAAIEAAEAGYDVFLVESNPFLGGRVIRSSRYFPKLCPPTCGLEINIKRLKANPRVRILILAEVENISGQEGDFEVVVKIAPRMVNDNCTACNKCAEVCPVERPNDLNFGMDKTKAIYLPHYMGFPMKYMIDGAVCTGSECAKCVAACQYDAIDLAMSEEKLNSKAGSVIIATGWKPYDATRIETLGFGKYPNVITNVMMERLAVSDGPTGGRIIRPSDGKGINSVAFVQCAGSRDKNHLPYCSAVCCLASLKQATYVKERYPEAKVFIFYMDIRAFGTLEDFSLRVQAYDGVSLVRGKVARVREDQETKDLIVEAEDTLAGQKASEKVDMVVLATGIVPSIAGNGIPAEKITFDDYGFIYSGQPGIYAAGCARMPADVSTSAQNATAAALKAIQSVVAGGANG